MLSRSFSLLPLPTAAFSTIMAKRKATAEELEARAESNGYRRGAYREEDSTRDNGKHNKKITRTLRSTWFSNGVNIEAMHEVPSLFCFPSLRV
jgi:hypothetical protein